MKSTPLSYGGMAWAVHCMLVLFFALPVANLAWANPSLGASAKVPRQALQELVRIKRPRGVIYVAIPQALIFGLNNAQNKPYCSPQVHATNSSHKTVEELIVGIRYKEDGDKQGKSLGSTITRFFLIKIGSQDTHFYNAIHASRCEGLIGELEITRCVYEDGTDCSADVQPVAYGSIPLKISKENN